METTSPPQPKQGWRRKRKLAYLLVLFLGCAAAYFAWDALFMPADLRQLQGTWQSVRFLEGDKELKDEEIRIAITGNRVSRIDAEGVVEEVFSVDIDPKRRELSIVEDKEIQIFGSTVRLPPWLGRGERRVRYHYEFIEGNLHLSLPMMDDTVAVEFSRVAK